MDSAMGQQTRDPADQEMPTSRPRRPIPPPGALLTLVQASLRNASALLADARLLLESGSAPRAHALGTLALEEVGKACLSLLAVLPMPEPMVLYGLKSKDAFWTAWSTHTDKLTWALGFLELLIRKSDVPATQALDLLPGHPDRPHRPAVNQALIGDDQAGPHDRYCEAQQANGYQAARNGPRIAKGPPAEPRC